MSQHKNTYKQNKVKLNPGKFKEKTKKSEEKDITRLLQKPPPLKTNKKRGRSNINNNAINIHQEQMGMI